MTERRQIDIDADINIRWWRWRIRWVLLLKPNFSFLYSLPFSFIRFMGSWNYCGIVSHDNRFFSLLLGFGNYLEIVCASENNPRFKLGKFLKEYSILGTMLADSKIVDLNVRPTMCKLKSISHIFLLFFVSINSRTVIIWSS